MIAKYDGKCDLTGAPITAGVTEIGRIGRFTVLAEYASPEMVDAWFARQVDEAKAILTEIAELLGRNPETYAAKPLNDFAEALQRRRSSRFANLKFDAEWVRSEIAGFQRRLEAQRIRKANGEI